MSAYLSKQGFNSSATFSEKVITAASGSLTTAEEPFAGMHPRPRASLSSFGGHTRSSSVASAETETEPSPQNTASTSRLRLTQLQVESKHQQRRPSLPFPLLALHNFKAEKRRKSAPRAVEVEESGTGTSSPGSSRRGSMATVGLQVHPLAGPSSAVDRVAESSSHARRRKPRARSDSVIQRERDAVEKWRKWALEQQASPTPAYDNFAAARRTSAPATALRYRTLSSSPSPSRSHFDPALSHLQHGLQGDITPRRSDSDRSRSTMEISEHPLENGQVTPTGTGISFRFSSFDDLAVDPTKINTNRPPVRPRVSTLPNPLVPLQKMLGARRTRPLMIELIHAVGLYIDAVWVVHRSGEIPPGQTPPSTSLEDEPHWVSPTLVAIAQARSENILSVPSEDDIAFYGTEVQEAVAEVEEALGGGKWSFARYLIEGGYGSVTTENTGGTDMGMIRLLGDMEDVLWGDAPPRTTDIQFELPVDFDPSASPSVPTTNITALCDFLAEMPRQGLGVVKAAAGGGAANSDMPSLRIPDLASVGTGSSAGQSEPVQGSEALLEEGRKRYRAWLEANQAAAVGA